MDIIKRGSSHDDDDDSSSTRELILMATPAAEPLPPPPPPFDALSKEQKAEFVDSRIQEIAASEARAQAGRKKLAEQTKAFRGYVSSTPAAQDEQLMTHFGLLLKAYQQEVDSLTKRSRAVESALQYLDPWIKLTLSSPPPAPPPAAPSAPSADAVARFQMQIDALNETLEDKELQAQLLRAERDKLAMKNTEVEQANLALGEELIAAKREISQLFEINGSKLTELERANATANQLRVEMTELVARTDAALETSHKAQNELQQKMSQLEDSLAEATRRATDAETNADHSVSQLKAKDAQLDAQTKELRLLQEELEQARLNDSQLELSRAAVVEDVTLQLNKAKQEAEQLHSTNKSLRAEADQLREELSRRQVEQPQVPAAGVTSLPPPDTASSVITALKEPLLPKPPVVPVSMDNEDTEDVWGWKDADEVVATSAPTNSAQPDSAPPPPAAAAAAAAAASMEPLASPVKKTDAVFSAFALKANMAQVMQLSGDVTEEELDKLEDMHHDQLRKISRARWDLLKKQMLSRP